MNTSETLKTWFILLLVRYMAFNMLDPLPLLFGLGSIITEVGSMPHLKLSSENKRNDDFLYQHFHSSGHLGLSHLTIQLIDRAMGERELRKKEGQWMYRLGTLRPQGLNEDDGFYAQNRKTRAGARRR